MVDTVLLDAMVPRIETVQGVRYLNMYNRDVLVHSEKLVGNASPYELAHLTDAIAVGLSGNTLHAAEHALLLAWDDLRFPAQGINPQGNVAPPTVDSSVFPGTLLFSPSAVNVVAGAAQMPHRWLAGSSIKPHIHWAKTSVNPNDVAWEFCYSIANVGDVFPAYSAWMPCGNPVPHANTLNKQCIAEWGSISMTGKRESCMVLWQIRRNTADVVDTYADAARLLEFDLHYQVCKFGTELEYPVAP
jgi:hypothetical protein